MTGTETGTEFENLMAEILRDYNGGHWTLVIPRNKSGAQPFDIIAIGRNSIYAMDCKVCSQPRFPLLRIEDNQWLAMEQFKKIRDDAIVGFFCYYGGDIYIIPYAEATAAQAIGQKSIRLSKDRFKRSDKIESYLFMGHDEIERRLNRKV